MGGRVSRRINGLNLNASVCASKPSGPPDECFVLLPIVGTNHRLGFHIGGPDKNKVCYLHVLLHRHNIFDGMPNLSDSQSHM